MNQTISSDEYEVIIVCDYLNSAEIPGIIKVVCSDLKELGTSYARNIGIEKSQGEIIILLDADMLVPNNFVEKHLNYHKACNNVIVLGSRRNLDKGIKSIGQKPLFKNESRDYLVGLYSEDINYFSDPWAICYTCNISLPGTYARKIRFHDGFNGWGLEDIEWAYRLWKDDLNWIYGNDAYAYHLHHNRSNTESRYMGWRKNMALFMKLHDDINVALFSMFSSVFDPIIEANFMDVFGVFNRTRRNENLFVFNTFGETIKDELYRLRDLLQYDYYKSDLLIIASKEMVFYMKVYAGYFKKIIGDYILFSQDMWNLKKEEYYKNYKTVIDYKEV